MPRTRCRRILAVPVVLAAGVCSPAAAAARGAPPALRLAGLFTDHMVVQRDQPVAVWGWARPGGRVRVTLASRTAAAVADSGGRWRATLPPLPAGGPHTLRVDGDTALTRRDVLVGEVWVASGQSNMEWPLMFAADGAEAVAAAADPRVRLFTVARRLSDAPAPDVTSDGWRPATPATAAKFSAVAFLFARRLRRELGVPVGVVHASWGGTPAEAWTSRAALDALPAGVVAREPAGAGGAPNDVPNADPMAALGRRDSADAAERAAWNRELQARDGGYAGGRAAWAGPAYDASAWPRVALPVPRPAPPEAAAVRDADGVVWFRRDVDLPAAWAGRDLTLRVPSVAGDDTTWVNGVVVGRGGASRRPRIYPVPASALRPGVNTVVIRLVAHGATGAVSGPPGAFRLDAGPGTAVPLAGTWRYRQSVDLAARPIPRAPGAPRGPSPAGRPAALFNGMVAPLAGLAMRGVIWYQGENNRSRAAQYRTLFPALVRDWRARWGRGDFPFLFVQLAGYLPPQPDPNAPSTLAALREAQAMTLRVPNTAMAVAVDVGDPDDVHPRDKATVADRLARAALGRVYGRPVEWSGPTYRAMRREGPAVRLTFDHAGGGLVSRGDTLGGFAVAGADRRFVWADARVDGATVVVSSTHVPAPVAVRYAWGDSPAATLYNRAGLPAVPFRTDDWPAMPDDARRAVARPAARRP